MFGTLTAIDWIGVAGSLIIAGAYLAVTASWVRAERPFFNIMNLAGAAMVLASLFYRPNAGAILIEVLWVGIALVALVRWFLARQRK